MRPLDEEQAIERVRRWHEYDGVRTIDDAASDDGLGVVDPAFLEWTVPATFNDEAVPDLDGWPVQHVRHQGRAFEVREPCELWQLRKQLASESPHNSQVTGTGAPGR
jgi:hypothetical protein